MTVDQDWRTRAACTRYPNTWWWEKPYFPDALHQCRTHCTVRDQCNTFAAQHKWKECVVAGQVWVAGKGPLEQDGIPSKRPQPSSSRLCENCRGQR